MISDNTKAKPLDKTAVMQSVTATDLRIGNLYEYFISDKNDNRKEWWEAVVCDAQDLVYLEKNPNDRDFRFLPLTEEWLLKLGFIVVSDNDFKRRYDIESEGRIDYVKVKHTLCLSGIRFEGTMLNSIKYVHQLQNFFFLITGRELTVA